MRNLVRLGAGAALLMFVSGAFAQVIDFQSLEHVDANIVTHGHSYDEDGFNVSKPQTDVNQFATFGTLASRYPGSTALFNNHVNSVITLKQIKGEAFDLDSIDIATLNGPGTVNVTFTNNRGEVQIHQRVEPDLPLNLETFNFDERFNNITSVSWVQASPFHQFDNIVVTPEPTTLGLLGVGALALLRRRG